MADLTAETRALLARLGVGPRKRLGQNFMVSAETLAAISKALDAGPQDRVIEIGPGLGFLTRVLAEKAKELILIEKDRAYAAYLREAYRSGSVKVFEADILKTEWKALGLPPGERVLLAGNIPYNITSPILEWLIDNRVHVKRAVLTVQREVAERLISKPGTKSWGPLSVYVQFYSEISRVCSVGRGSFWPAPRVDSAVIRIDFSLTPRVAVADEAHFFQTVRRAFQKRRKIILNALAGDPGSAWNRTAVTEALAKAGIDAMRRPETLTLEEWAAVSRAAFRCASRTRML